MTPFWLILAPFPPHVTFDIVANPYPRPPPMWWYYFLTNTLGSRYRFIPRVSLSILFLFLYRQWGPFFCTDKEAHVQTYVYANSHNHRLIRMYTCTHNEAYVHMYWYKYTDNEACMDTFCTDRESQRGVSLSVKYW
jgi:hypothetical protein